MKLSTVLILVWLIGVSNAFALDASSQRRCIRYTEKARNGNPSFQNQKLPQKAKRKSNRKGEIILTYDESLPDSIKLALISAKDIWENKLPTKQPIYINVEFEPLNDDIVLAADVFSFFEDSLYGCPSALATQISNKTFSSPDIPDGIIRFNSEINWNCQVSDRESQDYNLTTVALKGITRCLGFGSSLYYRGDNDFAFNAYDPMYFDYLLYNGEQNLGSLGNGSSEIAEFVTSDSVYVRTGSNEYKIYAPPTYVQDLSLCYFEDDNSLMSYSMGRGNVVLSIDDKTIDVLRAIGWDFPTYDFAIECEDIGSDGIGSSYSSHTFSLAKGEENVSDYNWKFFLKNKNGEYVKISTGNSEEFTIDKIDSPDNYFINIDGDLEGRIECDYFIYGEKHSSEAFAVSLELKPTILSIDNLSIIYNDKYTFYLTFDVQYSGANRVYIDIEEEYNSSIRNYQFDEPYLAHIKTGYITRFYYSWVTVYATNKYGTTYETLEFEPNYTNYSKDDSAGLGSLSDSNSHIEIYNINGILTYTGTLFDLFNQKLQPGIYIQKEINNYGIITTSKITIK